MSGRPIGPSHAEWIRHANRFVDGITILCCGEFDPQARTYAKAPDAGARAALRRGLGEPVERFGQAAHRSVLHVATAFGPEAVREIWLAERPPLGPEAWKAWERAYYAVAAMIATQARAARETSATPAAVGERGSLGSAVARFDREQPVDSETPREAELRALSKQSLDGIHRRLPKLVRQLRAAEIHIDWAQLIVDLAWWPQERDQITRRWNQTYYRTRYRQHQQLSQTSNDTDEREGETA